MHGDDVVGEEAAIICGRNHEILQRRYISERGEGKDLRNIQLILRHIDR